MGRGQHHPGARPGRPRTSQGHRFGTCGAARQEPTASNGRKQRRGRRLSARAASPRTARVFPEQRPPRPGAAPTTTLQLLPLELPSTHLAGTAEASDSPANHKSQYGLPAPVAGCPAAGTARSRPCSADHRSLPVPTERRGPPAARRSSSSRAGSTSGNDGYGPIHEPLAAKRALPMPFASISCLTSDRAAAGLARPLPPPPSAGRLSGRPLYAPGPEKPRAGFFSAVAGFAARSEPSRSAVRDSPFFRAPPPSHRPLAGLELGPRSAGRRRVVFREGLENRRRSDERESRGGGLPRMHTWKNPGPGSCDTYETVVTSSRPLDGFGSEPA